MIEPTSQERLAPGFLGGLDECAAVVDLSPSGRERWRRAFESLPEGDVYYHPGYALVLERNSEGSARCLILETGDGLLLYPFLVRPIPELLRRAVGVDAELFDIVTPYGYGGPALHGRAPGAEDRLLRRCREQLATYASEEGIVAEFVRFHPVLGNHRGDPSGLRLEQRSRTVAVDLAREESRLWAELAPSCRNKARRAEKAGVVVEEDTGLRHLEAFHRNYLETMRRAGAAASYHYPRQFFIDTLELLRGDARLFVARLGDRVVNAALVLQRGPHAHYHFSGSDPEAHVPGANNWLLFQVALWARARGARTFHLGGGRHPDDSLFQFKASFSPVHLEFWTGTACHDPEAYRRLSAAAAALRPPGAPVDPGFFPAYRA